MMSKSTIPTADSVEFTIAVALFPKPSSTYTLSPIAKSESEVIISKRLKLPITVFFTSNLLPSLSGSGKQYTSSPAWNVPTNPDK